MLAPDEGVVIGEKEAHTFGVSYENNSDISSPTFCNKEFHITLMHINR